MSDLAAQNEFLLHMLNHFYKDRSPTWNEIRVPGKTTKALKNQWTKVRKQLAELRERSGEAGSEETPTPVKRGRKPGAGKAKAGGKRAAANGDGEDVQPPKKAKKEKAEETEESDDDSDIKPEIEQVDELNT